MREAEKERLLEKLRLSRSRLLTSHPFYGLLLLKATLGLDSECKTAYTDGKRIRFSPSFLSTLSDSEVDLTLCHEILHIALGHCFRSTNLQSERFNVACDIVINSIILLENNGRLSTITIRKWGPLMHETPDGRPGHLFTAEQVYAMLPPETYRSISEKTSDWEGVLSSPGFSGRNGKKRTVYDGLDDHSKWALAGEDDMEEWEINIQQAIQTIEKMNLHNKGCGLSPALKGFLIGRPKPPKLNWKEILNCFIQEEVTDYSLVPPDKRYQGDFFIPDFSEKSESAKDVLFMIDTSGSMSDEQILDVYSEVFGAVAQFGGRLKGWLGFFDAAVVPPKPFEDDGSLKKIKAAGRGGTSFEIIFDYVGKVMEPKPASIVILTDGGAPWPEEKKAMGIPVMWVINNDDVTPPWGKTIRLLG